MKSKDLILIMIPALFLASCTDVMPPPRPRSAVYGEMWSMNNNITTTIPAVDTYVNVTEGMQVGFLRNVTYSSGILTVNREGIYQLVGSYSATGGNNKVFHLTVGVNGIETTKDCHMPRKVAASDQGVWGLSCLLNLTVGDQITSLVENVNDGSDILVTDSNLMIMRVDEN